MSQYHRSLLHEGGHNSKWLTDNLLQEGIYGLNYTTGCNNVFVIYVPFTKSIHQHWVSQILLAVVESQI